MDLTQYERAFGTQAILIVIAAVLALVAAIVVATVTSRPGPTRRRRVRRAALAVASFGAAVLTAFVALTPRYGPDITRVFELNPLGEYARPGGAGYTTSGQVLGNLLMLTWIGLLLPGLFRRLTYRLTVALTFAASAVIEACQYAFATGRIASTQDLALNTLGGIVAAVIGVKVIRPWADGPAARDI
ncbi:MAG: VanZ family protein [Demequinaceae bacterium]|nr:VanZ family protein [Demequinaceae bacterium]